MMLSEFTRLLQRAVAEQDYEMRGVGKIVINLYDRELHERGTLYVNEPSARGITIQFDKPHRRTYE